MIEYDNCRIAELLKRLNLTRADIRRDLAVTNDATVKRWIEGGDIYISRVVDFCNTYKISILEFFNEDGRNLLELCKNKEIETIDISDNVASLLIKKEQELSEIRIQAQRDIFAVKETAFAAREKYITELADLKISLKEEEQKHLREQYEEQRAKQEKEIADIKEVHAKQLADKDEEIAKLRRDMNNLQLEYKELEMSMGGMSRDYKPIAVAEPNKSYTTIKNK